MNSKKKTYNGFFFFMTHIKDEHGAKGIRISMQEASKIAGAKWEKMSIAEKKPFEERAKREKSENKLKQEKLTSQGVPFSIVDREQAEIQHAIFRMKNNIVNTISVAQLNNSLATTDFFLIDINIFCECSGYYVPAEFAVSRFNLSKGVYDTYHTLINPGSIPIGYASSAIENSNSTHQLPVPPNALGESSMIDVLTNFSKFLLEDREILPYIYTLPDNMKIVSAILKQICSDEDVDLEFEIYNLTELFFHLRNACANEQQDTYFLCELALARDVYDFFEELACEYHETTDVINHCSLSRVKRWGYNLADYCCGYLGIELIPGMHLPLQAGNKDWKSKSGIEKKPIPDEAKISANQNEKNDFSESTSEANFKFINAELRKPYSKPKVNEGDAWSEVSRTSSALSANASEFKPSKCEPIRQPKSYSKIVSTKPLGPRGRGRSIQNSQ